MAGTVYIETTIPSAYTTRRRDPRSLSRREDTRMWWREQRADYDCFTSQETVNELTRGAFPGQAEALSLIAEIPRLGVTEEILAISELYVQQKLMPGPAGTGDSLHLALASFYRIDYLLTWNIGHLANRNKVDHLVVVNRRLALFTPAIVTPELLWAEDI